MASPARSSCRLASAMAFSRTSAPRSRSPSKSSARASPASRPIRSSSLLVIDRRERLFEQLDRIPYRYHGAPAGVLVADRRSGEQLRAVQRTGDLGRRREGLQRIGRLARPMADRAELEQGVGALGLALDPDLDCRAQPHRGIVEGKRGARRSRRTQVVVDRPLGPAERGGRAEVMGEVRERAVGARGGALQGLPDAEVQLGPPQPREPVVKRPSHDLVGEAVGQPLARGAPRSCRCPSPPRARRAARARQGPRRGGPAPARTPARPRQRARAGRGPRGQAR